jgi:hypothetical protein
MIYLWGIIETTTLICKNEKIIFLQAKKWLRTRFEIS